MPIKDNVNNLADKAKWKVNQQTRLLNIHNSISQKEINIKVQKANLADTAVKLFYNNQLNDENIKSICIQIQAIYNEIDNLKTQEVTIRNEKPPENLSSYDVRSPIEEVGISTGSLVCPKCGRELRGKFCPEHGIPGVERKPIGSEPAKEAISIGLICPVCGRELSTQFCPNDGTKGVPKPSSEIPDNEDSPKTDTDTQVLFCPVCKKTLTTRFCNQHGVEGVPLAKIS